MMALPRLADYLAHFASTTPNAAAAVDEGRTYSYQALQSLVGAARLQLLGLGVKPGDRVAMLAVPGADYLVVMLATTSLGAIWIGLNPRYQYDESRYVVADAAPAVVFHLEEFEGRDYRADFARLAREVSSINHVVPFAAGAFLEQRPMADVERLPSPDPMAPAVIVYTSGSTGAPKGAVLTHFALVYGARAQLNRWRLSSPARQICFFPVNHVGCVGDITATTLVAGGCLTFHHRFDPGQVNRAIDQGAANIFLAIPTMLLLMRCHPSWHDDLLGRLELLVWGGAPASRSEVQRWVAAGPRLATLYGMTEACANTTYTVEGASVDELCETIGKPLPEFPTRIVDGGRLCGVDEPGEIQHHGPYLTLGYWQRPEATREAFTADGWYRTGDIGAWRSDGNIRFVGRITEMFKSGGYNVYPREVEIALEQHPAVAQVAVVPVPDPLYHEVGVAFVVPELGQQIRAEELARFCGERLANYKRPKRFEIRSELPRVPAGKIDKVTLRQEAMARGVDEAEPT